MADDKPLPNIVPAPVPNAARIDPAIETTTVPPTPQPSTTQSRNQPTAKDINILAPYNPLSRQPPRVSLPPRDLSAFTHPNRQRLQIPVPTFNNSVSADANKTINNFIYVPFGEFIINAKIQIDQSDSISNQPVTNLASTRPLLYNGELGNRRSGVNGITHPFNIQRQSRRRGHRGYIQNGDHKGIRVPNSEIIHCA